MDAIEKKSLPVDWCPALERTQEVEDDRKVERVARNTFSKIAETQERKSDVQDENQITVPVVHPDFFQKNIKNSLSKLSMIQDKLGKDPFEITFLKADEKGKSYYRLSSPSGKSVEVSLERVPAGNMLGVNLFQVAISEADVL